MGISIKEYKEILSKSKSSRGKLNPNPKMQIQGKANRELGRVFEEKIEIMCDIYEKNGLAKIEKTPEPMKILKHIEDRKI